MDGGKIGSGAPTTPAIPTQSPAVENKSTSAKPESAGPRDQFEVKSGATTRNGNLTQVMQEKTKGADVLKLARDNPAAARQLVANLALTTSSLMTSIETEKAALRLLLEQLSAKRFKKSEVKKESAKLKQHRANLRKLKLQLQISQRKMNLLEQIAGKLGNPKLESEISRILQRHQKLRSRWGKRHHLLSLGKVLYDAEEETPKHLEHVVQTEVPGGLQAEQLSEQLEEISPRRNLSEMMVRTIDGSVKTAEQTNVREKTFGHYTELTEVIHESLTNDPRGGSS